MVEELRSHMPSSSEKIIEEYQREENCNRIPEIYRGLLEYSAQYSLVYVYEEITQSQRKSIRGNRIWH